MKKLNNLQNNQKGFTLLELLVVVGILATVGGAVIASMGNQEENAAQGTATNSIASLENSMRVYSATQGQLPNDLESLACIPYAAKSDVSAITTVVNGPSITLSDSASAYKLGGVSNLNGVGGGLGAKVAGKFDLIAVPDVSGLTDAGVTSLRYAATMACDETDGDVEMGVELGGAAADAVVSGKLSEVTIPNHIFEAAREGSSRNRGRGFSHTIENDSPMMVWKRGTTGYNNIKVGAGATDVVVGLGIGQASSMVGSDSTALLSKAPFYGQIARDKYAHYIALVKVGTDADGDLTSGFSASTAEVVAVVDARGDFLDEEIAEFTDQKQQTLIKNKT